MEPVASTAPVGAPAPSDRSPRPRNEGLRRALLLASAAAPACLAAAHLGNVPDGAHDAAVARAMGLGAGGWRALDAAVASLFVWLPLGTRSARAELAEALVLAAAGAVVFVLARAAAGSRDRAPRLGAMTAAVASLAATCAPSWQMEGASVGGSATGALLALLPLAALAREGEESASSRRRLAGLGVGLALGYEPLAGACAVAACAALVLAGPEARRGFVEAWTKDARALVACVLAGLVPLVVAALRTRAQGVPLAGALGDAWAGEVGASSGGSPVAFVRDELGTVLGLMAVAGAVLAVRTKASRALGAGLVAVVVVGLGAGWAGAAVGPSRVGAPVLAGQAAACALAGVAMQALVVAVAEARVPAARASAAMVMVLLFVIPVDEADEALLRALPRASGAAAVWDDIAWGSLPPMSVVLATDARLTQRAAAAEAEGSLRGDLAVVPVGAPGVAAARVLATDPALVPLWRDLALTGMPSEASLSSLAASRSLAMAYEPRWGRAMAKHLVPAGLLDRFEPEPRGASDRRRGLDAFAPKRDRLARAVANDPDLAEAAAYLARARGLDIAASGDR